MNKKILVIEDELSMQNLLKDTFEERGFEVLTASDGQNGLKIALSRLPDLILLDIILPKMDGFEVLAGIKTDLKAKNIPVILLTNLSQPEDIQKAIELGATTYLVKSEYQLSDIVDKIEQTLRIEN